MSDFNARWHRLAQFTRRGPKGNRGDQGAWNWLVGLLYAKGAPVREAMHGATLHVREANPHFAPIYGPDLLSL
jgi:hypothetical protein